MKTRSVKSSQVSALSTVTGGADGASDVRSKGRRHGPRLPRSSQAEAAPGPPLTAKVTGRLAGSAPSRRKATVAISAMGARLSALLKRIAEAIALKRSLRPGRSIVWEVVAGAGKGFCAAGAWACSAAWPCCAVFRSAPLSVFDGAAGAGGSSAPAGETATDPKIAAARVQICRWWRKGFDRNSTSAYPLLMAGKAPGAAGTTFGLRSRLELP